MKRHDLVILEFHFRGARIRIYLPEEKKCHHLDLGLRLRSTRQSHTRIVSKRSSDVPEGKFLVRRCPFCHCPGAAVPGAMLALFLRYSAAILALFRCRLGAVLLAVAIGYSRGTTPLCGVGGPGGSRFNSPPVRKKRNLRFVHEHKKNGGFWHNLRTFVFAAL